MLINRDKLKDIIPAIAGKLKFRPAIIEKDYYLTVILNNIETVLSDKIIFKGGTLLNKIHLNYHRLSEDLDFTYYGKLTGRSQRSIAIAPIREKMPAFLKALDLSSNNPQGEGFNNSMQYVFKINYQSLITAKKDLIKIEISLRQPPIDRPIHTSIKHFYQDPFTGEDLIPIGKILSLSLKEAVAEKLKASITRKDVVIRDYYDLWHISETDFNFYDQRFIKIFKQKLADESYTGDYRQNFGLSPMQLSLLHNQVDTLLLPVIRVGEEFNLDAVLNRFNTILSHKLFY